MNKKYLVLLGAIGLLFNLSVFADGEFAPEDEEAPTPVPVSDVANSSDDEVSDKKEEKKKEEKKADAKKQDVLPFLSFGAQARGMNSGDSVGAGGFISGGAYAYGGVYKGTISSSGPIAENKDGTAKDGEYFTLDASIQRGGGQICGEKDAGKYFCFNIAGDGKLQYNAQADRGQAGVGLYLSPLVRMGGEDGSWEFRAGPSFGGEILHTGTLLPDGDTVTIAGLSPLTQAMASLETPIFNWALSGGYTFDFIPDNDVAGLVKADTTILFNPLSLGAIDMGIYGSGSVTVDVQNKETKNAVEYSSAPYDATGQVGVLIGFGKKDGDKSREALERHKRMKAEDADSDEAEALK